MAPETIWKALTTGDLIGRWLMAPTGFEPVKDKHFTFQTTPDGEWDGVIRCQVLEVTPNERLVYAWRSGHDSNAGYVSRLDTVVTGRRRHPDSPGAFRLRHTEERFCFHEYEPRMAEGHPEDGRHRRGRQRHRGEDLEWIRSRHGISLWKFVQKPTREEGTANGGYFTQGRNQIVPE
jgi:uncharacterized protein YndB with AHSA1/START domain